MNYLLKNMLTGGRLLCPIYRTECNRFLDHLDFHPHYELYFCHSPLSQRIFVNGREYTVREPNVMILPPFTVHHISLTHPMDTFERYVVYFNEDFLSQFGDAVLPSSLTDGRVGVMFPLDTEGADRILTLLQNLYEREASRAEQATGLATLLNRLDRLVPTDSRVCFERISDEMPRILEYIDRNVAEDLNADLIARKFNISRAKLDRDFRRYVGQTVHQTVIDCRLSSAIGLLRRTDRPIAEIANVCGFESEYYFYAFFKRNTGLTPSEVRKKRTDPL